MIQAEWSANPEREADQTLLQTNCATNKAKPEGVYKNERLMHACSTIVGCTVHLQTKDGSVYEGIFNTFSPTFTICLGYAVQIDPKSDSKDTLYAAVKGGAQVEQQAFFDLADIVRITATEVDFNYAIKDTNAKLTTDADISGYDPTKSTGDHRQLETWQDEDGDQANDGTLLSLDDVANQATVSSSLGANDKEANRNDNQNGRGWNPQEMFKFNEEKYNISTTYDEKLTDYTVPLTQKQNTKEWRKKSDRAAAIAKDIEGNSKSQSRLAKEDDDGDDEEEKFSAVIRPTAVPPSGAGNRPVVNNNTRTDRQDRVERVNQDVRADRVDRIDRQADRNRMRYNYRPTRTDSLKNFGQKLNIAPPRQPQAHGQQPHHHNQQQQQQQQQHQQQPQQLQQQHHPTPPQSKQHQHTPQPSMPQNQSPGSQHHPKPQLQSQHQLQQQAHSSVSQQHQAQSQHQPSNQAQQSVSQQASTPVQVTVTSATTTTVNTSVTATTSPSTATTASTPIAANTSSMSERSDTSSSLSNKEHQSEIARKSKLNPNAKEFVYKPKSPAVSQAARLANGTNSQIGGQNPAIDAANSSPMSQAPHAGPYYQQVPVYAHGLSPHQQQHHAAQFIPNPSHPHFQNQIHYMSTVPPQFAQQMSQRYIRGNFRNYYHGSGGVGTSGAGPDHHNNTRPDYSQAQMIAPTSTGQPFMPSPVGAPHPMNAYPGGSPQQPMIYGGHPQSMYPMVQAGFPQPMHHVMPNPTPYDGSTMYMPPQNYIVNPQ